MSLTTIRAGIHTGLRTYTGVTNIIAGMPDVLHLAPAFITQFEGARRVGQTTYFEWRFLITAVLESHALELSESTIDEMVAPVFEAFSPKLTDAAGHFRSQLGGAANTCWFDEIRSGEGDGYISFGSGEAERRYRRIAFPMVVKTHEEY